MFLTQKKSVTSLKTRKPIIPRDFHIICSSFDDVLFRRLKSIPIDYSLSSLSRAVDFLSTAHADAHKIISDLTSSSHHSTSFFFDHTLNLLNICNAISSHLDRLRHRLLLITFALRLLDGATPPPDKIKRAADSLANFDNHDKTTTINKLRGGGGVGVGVGGGFKIREPDALIEDLADAVDRIAPRGKISTAEKAVQHIIYSLGVVTVLVAGIAVSALCGVNGFSNFRVSAEFVWADLVNDIGSAGSMMRLKEVDDVAERAGVLREVLNGAVLGEVEEEKLRCTVTELKSARDVFSEGLDGFADGVNQMFGNVLSRRNGALDNYRVGSSEKQERK